jgi:phage baseplate assembly protein gpV
MLLKFGKITEVDAAKGLAKVTFAENDNLVSRFLPMSMPKTLQDKYIIPYDINEHVWCIMDENCEDGVIAGAIYDENNLPDGGAAGKIRAKFVPNLSVEFDRATRTLSIIGGDVVSVQMGTTVLEINNGFLIKRDDETLRKIVSDLIDQINLIVVPTNVGPSGNPVNAAAFNAIKTRAQSLLK